MTAKVRYSKEEPDAYTDFNDGYFDDDPNEFLLTCEREGDVGLFEGEQNSCLGEQNSHFTLLSVPTRYLPFDIQEGTLKFKIEKNKLEKLDFSACYLEFCK